MCVESRLLLHCYVLYNSYNESCRLRLHLEHQLSIQRHTCLRHFSPALVDSDPSMHIQAASKERVDWYSCYALIPFQMISNDRLELLSKIRTPKLREWGTNCLRQISYFLFYPSSGTADIMPQPFSTRDGPPHWFNVTTRFEGPPQVQHQ